jgi:hypothetical protein
MNSLRFTTAKNTMLIYVHSFQFCHIYFYNLTKPEFKNNCWHQVLGYNLLLTDFSSEKLYLKMIIPIIKPDNLSKHAKIICDFFKHIYRPTKVKHHLTCFNNIFSNNELISNRFAIFATCTHILIYLWNRLLIDFYLCVYDRVCKVPRVLFNICICERKLIFFV